MDLQEVIDESRPMLEEFLSDLGIYRAGQCIADPQLLDAFSGWVAAQTVSEHDFFYLASRVGAFISEYVIEGNSGVRYIRGNRIMLRFPVGDGVFEEIDPYEVAAVFIRGRGGLKEFLSTL
jgi:hypothetical protein